MLTKPQPPTPVGLIYLRCDLPSNPSGTRPAPSGDGLAWYLLAPGHRSQVWSLVGLGLLPVRQPQAVRPPAGPLREPGLVPGAALGTSLETQKAWWRPQCSGLSILLALHHFAEAPAVGPKLPGYDLNRSPVQWQAEQSAGSIHGRKTEPLSFSRSGMRAARNSVSILPKGAPFTEHRHKEIPRGTSQNVLQRTDNATPMHDARNACIYTQHRVYRDASGC